MFGIFRQDFGLYLSYLAQWEMGGVLTSKRPKGLEVEIAEDVDGKRVMFSFDLLMELE